MSQTIATIADVPIPDTPLVREATELVRAATNDLLFDHCRRVYLWGTLKGRARGLTADSELLYIGAMFHDLGLSETYRRTDQRFEIDGADAARDFLRAHRRSEKEARAAWLAIALHNLRQQELQGRRRGVGRRESRHLGIVFPRVVDAVRGVALSARRGHAGRLERRILARSQRLLR
jgi:hypothetical protein